MNSIDKKTLEIITSKHNVLDVIAGLCGYIQELNKEVREIKCVVEGIAGFEIHKLDNEQKQKLREGGDILTDIRKIIKQGERIKNGRS